MPCYRPISGWKSVDLTEKGKHTIVFSQKKGYTDSPREIPCGVCIGCRLEKSRQWAIRITHEASLWDSNVFVTLTYDDENCPSSLNVKDYQLFMKRLRKHFNQEKIRFFMGAEYGEQTHRPHYHAILFNCDFPDKTIVTQNQNSTLYNSQMLNDLWQKGHTSVGEVTLASAQYVAKYTLKKISGPKAREHYNGKKPEFAIMSRKPGIGTGWIEKFHKDVYPDDFVVTPNGQKAKVPKFYDNYLDKTNYPVLESIKSERVALGRKYSRRQKRLFEKELYEHFHQNPNNPQSPSTPNQTKEKIKLAQLQPRRL